MGDTNKQQKTLSRRQRREQWQSPPKYVLGSWLKVSNYFLNLARSLPETPRSLKPANMDVSDTAVTIEQPYYAIYTEALTAGRTTSSISHYCDDSLHQLKALNIPAEKKNHP